ncbi:conserved hypothetical protein [Planktothrix sp. PCC 11201]|uniref:CFI-box-CTERM domain-containing protein n=1 Tax=Planktothrix sp. PCC 11201 TaxID=1729650 RepID=UPI0009164770|nr:CFI-box-CTERM domain-containing protein [Planktothrix sp. PCC 11201]SKB14860.1 conserved hypothetical protein [Planktothrix sp. PCC 11201]
MPYKSYRSYDEAIAAFQKAMDRGLYYLEQGDDNKCEQEYVDALQAIRSLYNFWSSPRNLKEFYVARLFELYDALKSIMGVAQNKKTRIYLALQLKKIEGKLAEYEEIFTAEELQEYNDIRNPKGNMLYPMTVDLIIKSNQAEGNQYSLDEIQKKSYKEEEDPILQDIRDTLGFISGYEFENGKPKFPLVLEKKSSSGCFIATAAYSTPIHPDLDTFRAFRDKKLLTNWIGNKLVEMYYQLSPSVAEYINQKPGIKRFVRRQLERLATWMRNQGITRN